MNRYLLVSIFSLFIIGGCTSSKKIKTPEPKPKTIKVTNVTMQEMVSGTISVGSTYNFTMNIETGSGSIIPDSLSYDDVKAKLLPSVSDSLKYTAKVISTTAKSSFKTSNKKYTIITFKTSEKPIVMRLDSVHILDEIHLP